MIVASDLNGTLTTGSPILAVARWVKNNQPDRYPPGWMPRVFLSYFQVKLGLVAIDTWGDQNMRRVLDLVDASAPETLDQVMQAVARDELWKKRRQEPIEVLRNYLQSGAEIILISATYQPAVQQFAELIGSEKTRGIGTPVTVQNGRIRLAENITSREQKLIRLKETIGDTSIQVALGDTFADIPLLEQAETAIAVYPDKILRETALSRNWRIIEN